MSEARSGRHLRLVPAIDTQPASPEPKAFELAVVGMSDRDLARRLARVKLVSIDTVMWRHVSPREESRPESGDGATNAGGRFNPRGSFPVVYGALRRAAAGEEFRVLARRHPIGIAHLLPRHLYRFKVRSSSVLDLRLEATRETLGLPPVGMASVHRTHSQLIGEIARALGIQAILAPNAAGKSTIVAIFPELMPASGWEFQHAELWATIKDVPGGTELKNSPPKDDLCDYVVGNSTNESFLSMDGN